jgi:hypothetical protein
LHYFCAMRLLLLLSLTILTYLTSNAQTGYDSLRNFMGGSPNAYIGETLYLKPLPDYKQAEGYEGFLTDPTKDKYDKTRIYKCDVGGYHSQHNELAGKDYTVVKVLPHPKATATRYTDIHYLQLKTPDGSSCYYEYNAKLEHKFPFITQGYWQKARMLYTGKQYIVKNSVLKNKVDVTNEKLVTSRAGEIWTCIDIATEQEEGKLSIVLQDAKGQKFFTPLTHVQIDAGAANFFTPETAAANKQKYGDFWISILQSEVKQGMSAEMCQLAWGMPVRMNNSNVQGVPQEQWVYDDGHYLYLKNGKLFRVQ